LPADVALAVRHLPRQARVIAALGGTALQGLLQKLAPPRSPPALPGPELTAEVRPPAPALVRDYLRHLGADPGAYRGVLPPHLFPQWTVPLAARTLRGLPYPLLRMVNAGCRLEINASLPAGVPLTVRARLEEIAGDGRRVRLRQRLITGTSDCPDALVAYLYTVIPLSTSHSLAPVRRGEGRGEGAGIGEKSGTPHPHPLPGGPGRGGRTATPTPTGETGHKEKGRVPGQAREIGRWELSVAAGREFAMLTGDVNPIHWLRPYARAFGFRGTILHGFSSMARAMEGVNRALFAGAVDRFGSFDVQLTRPLVLPARVGLYLDGQTVHVGEAPGGPEYLRGECVWRKES
jgi:acyl dehydratase